MKKFIPIALIIVVCAAFAFAIWRQVRAAKAIYNLQKPSFNRFPIPHADAQVEAAELDRLRLERTFESAQAIAEAG
jgi:hypothetical protein